MIQVNLHSIARVVNKTCSQMNTTTMSYAVDVCERRKSKRIIDRGEAEVAKMSEIDKLMNAIEGKIEKIEAIDSDEMYLYDYENWVDALDWVLAQGRAIKRGDA